jgi:hypothetical protein
MTLYRTVFHHQKMAFYSQDSKCGSLHDGSSPYSSIAVRTFLNWTWLKWWIVWGAPVAWSARSSDVKLLYFYLWDHLKSTMYATAVNDVAELQQRVEDRRELIYNTTGICERVWRSLRWCAGRSVEGQRQHFIFSIPCIITQFFIINQQMRTSVSGSQQYI